MCACACMCVCVSVPVCDCYCVCVRGSPLGSAGSIDSQTDQTKGRETNEENKAHEPISHTAVFKSNWICEQHTKQR